MQSRVNELRHLEVCELVNTGILGGGSSQGQHRLPSLLMSRVCLMMICTAAGSVLPMQYVVAQGKLQTEATNSKPQPNSAKQRNNSP